MFVVREIVLLTGERIAVVADQATRLPDPYTTRYVLSALRPRGLAFNTIRTKLKGVLTLLDFLEYRKIFWPERVVAARFLDYDEVSALAEACRLDRRTKSRPVNQNTSCYAFRTCVEYLVWLSTPLVARISDPTQQLAVRKSLDQFHRMATGLSPRVMVNTLREAKGLGLSDNQRNLFLSIIAPGSVDNPYSVRHQHRNQTLLLLQYFLECRAGEILSIKIRDFNFIANPATITIHRRADDPEDPRPRKPTAKTRARILEIGDDLRDVVEKFILSHRADRKRSPLARRHPFLAVNRFGAPLSERSFERLFSVLRLRCPELGMLVSHLLRHDWNDRFLADAAKSKDDYAKTEKEQIYAMGWSDYSKMPMKYGRQSISRSANKKIVNMQDNAYWGRKRDE